MRSLALIESAKPKLLGFVSAFEMTYYDVERKQRGAAAPAAMVEKQLTHMADKCSDLARYLGKMHLDAIHEWGRAAGVGGPISIWQLSEILDESASSAEQALEAFKGDQRAGATRGFRMCSFAPRLMAITGSLPRCPTETAITCTGLRVLLKNTNAS